MKNNKKLTAVILAIILGCGISLAGCGNNETQTETGTNTPASSQKYNPSVSNSTEPTMSNQEPSSSVSSDEPSTQAPVLKETVLKGTNSSVLTIHTNGTYDFVCSDYYLSTKDYPALKALLIMEND